MRVDRVVFDTNILISATFWPTGVPAQCVRWAFSHCVVVASEPLLQELTTRITRPKFDKYSSPGRLAWMFSTVVKGVDQVALRGDMHVCRDPDDDKILETAVIGKADCIVTGDKDLLILHPFRGIRIMLPKDFLALVAGTTP
jgi:uncharacterized protein